MNYSKINNNKRYVFIIALLFLLSCSSNRILTTSEIVGSYHVGDYFELNKYIDLFDDSSFEYRWQMGLLYGKTTGMWKLEGKRIILNSDKQPLEKGAKKYEISSIEREPSDSLRVGVFDLNNQPISFAHIILKLDSKIVTGKVLNIEGTAVIAKQKVDEILISAMFLEPISHSLDSTVSFIEFKLYEYPDKYYQFFTNEVWKYKKGRLYAPSIKGDKYMKGYFLKEDK